MFTIRVFMAGIVAAVILSGTTASAQETEATGMLEEVIVTSQKREQTLQEVPISIVAISGDKIREANVYKMEDLQLMVPNLQMTESGISTQIYIRGIGSGNSQGFEQSVGMYVDGIYFGRQQLIREPIFDLQRVEVLRGPQGILFGKNAIAGAVAYTTAQPTQEFGGYVRAEYDWEHDATLIEAVINGGLTDTFSVRVAARKFDDEGWLTNNTEQSDGPQRDDGAIRAAFRWDATDTLDMTLKFQRSEFDTEDRQLQIIQDDPALPGFPIPGATYAQILGFIGAPQAIPEAELNEFRASDGQDFSFNEVDNVTFTLNWDLGNNVLTAVTGWLSYELDENCDCDFTGGSVFTAELNEKYDQFSQEIRLVSPGGETLDWIIGGFYQKGEMDFIDAIIAPPDSVLGNANPALVPLLNTFATRTFTQDSELWAVFGQGTWNFNDSWALTFGARWTTEDKEGERILSIKDLSSGNVLPNFPESIAPAVWTGFLAIQNEQFTGHNVSGTRDEDAFLPLLRLEYRPSGDQMYYLSASEGFKAGGYDPRSNNVNSFAFENEEARSYELGGKFIYAGGRAETNIAFYYTDYDDLQSSQCEGTLGFNVGNAKSTRVQGVELDGRLLSTDGLTWTSALAYLNHKYRDFENANCYSREVPDGDIVDGVPLCSRSGDRGQYTPKWTAYTSLEYFHPVGTNWDFQITGDLSYSSKQNTHVNLDPQYEIDSLTFVDLRVAFFNENWVLAVLGQNLTGEEFLTYVGNVPLSGTAFGTNTFYGFTTRERSYWAQATYRF